MKHRISFLLVLLLLVPALATGAEYTIWYSPLNFVPEDPSIIIEPYDGNPRAVRVTTPEAGDLQWIMLGLDLPTNVEIRSIELCYRLYDSTSYISAIRLTQMTMTEGSLIIWDDGTDLTDVGPTCYTSMESPESVEGTITLALRLNSAEPFVFYIIGGIGVTVEEVPTGFDEPLGFGTPQLQPSVPNPFRDQTTISYDLSTPAKRVELQIHDVNGRRVRSMAVAGLAAGRHVMVWDGRNNAGNRVAAGTYFSKIVADGIIIGTGDMVHLR
jgi:hypothetical protein